MKYHIFLTFLVSLSFTAAAMPSFKEGEITLTIKQGKRVDTLLYQKKGNNLRIHDPGKHIPAKPVNYIDLKTGVVRILLPHNSTWTEVPAARLKPRKASAFPEPPKPIGIEARPAPLGTPGKLHTPKKDQPQKIQDPQKPVIPKMPEMPKPALPDGSPLPAGIGPQPDSGKGNQAPTVPTTPQIPVMPQGMPEMPGGNMPEMMPGINQQEMKLTAEKETRTLHGYLCKKHTLTIPGEGVMTLWLSDSKDLPPFHTLMYEAPHTRGRIEWRQQWTALLREKHLFPMLTILHPEPERRRERGDEKTNEPDEKPATPKPQPEIARWEITAISSKTIKDKEGKLFKVPETAHKMELFPF
jgi:hypothetical protein